jgi:hypothetical protein
MSLQPQPRSSTPLPTFSETTTGPQNSNPPPTRRSPSRPAPPTEFTGLSHLQSEESEPLAMITSQRILSEPGIGRSALNVIAAANQTE